MDRWMTWCGVMLACLVALPLSGCGEESGGGDDGPAEGQVRAVATVGMVADVVRHVGGEHVHVETLIHEGIDPHLFAPTQADVKALLDAEVVFYNGLKLEGRMGDVLERAAEDRPTVAVAERLREREGYLQEDEAGHYDPHVWMDAGAWSVAADVVAEALSAYDPEHAADYAANAAAYKEQLAALDAYARETLASIPEAQRVLVTAHDAFGYMGSAYGIEVQGIQGLSTESEAGVQRINALVALVVGRGVPAVFVETSVPSKSVEALIAGCAAQGHDVVIGGSLYSDAMGPSGSYEGTYVGMIDHNVTTIARALGGTAGAGGMSGRLGAGDE